MAADNKGLIVVTGATGFIALHCVKRLLEAGYRVRGTVRTAEKGELVRASLRDVSGVEDRLEIAALELTDDSGWEEAFAGAKAILHTASPVPKGPPKNEDEIIIPATEGLSRAMHFAKKAGVERVVMTSSVAAINAGNERPPGKVFTEADWSTLSEHTAAYDKSKTLAEKKAWELSEELGVPLSVLNPVYVLGPSLSGADNASNEIVRKVLDREMPGVPRMMFPLADVRDVAEAHLRALESDAALGKRFIICGEHPWYIDIVRAVGKLGHKVNARELPNWLVHVVSWFDPIVRLITDDLGVEIRYSSTRAEEILGLELRSAEESIADTVESILTRRAQVGLAS